MPILGWLNKGEAVRTAKQVPYRLLQGVKVSPMVTPTTKTC